MTSYFSLMRACGLAFLGIILGVGALSAQSNPWRPTVLLAGGFAGQVEAESRGFGDHTEVGTGVGEPGYSLAVGAEWLTGRSWAFRLEAQTFRYSTDYAYVWTPPVDNANRIDALSALAIWTPSRSLPFGVQGGAAVLSARVPLPATNAVEWVTRGTVVVGASLRLISPLSVDVQYLPLVGGVGKTKGLLTSRVVLRF